MRRISQYTVGCALALALIASPAGPVQAAPSGTVVLFYMFQDYSTNARATDLSGRGHHAIPLRSNGGSIRAVTRADGRAAAFPAPCRPSSGHKCPRAILQAANHPDLNPGTRSFRYGAIVMLRPAETSAGSNVIQKGYYTSAAQWKLQVDGRGGRPSCVLARSGHGYLVAAGVSVADGGWHQVDCRRAGRELSIAVDGRVRGRIGLPANLNISNSEPVRIGGRSTAQSNDQFFGSVDNVYFSLG